MATPLHERGVRIYRRLDQNLRHLIENNLDIELGQLKSRSKRNYQSLIKQISWILSIERTPNGVLYGLPCNDEDIGLPHHKIYFGFLSTPEERVLRGA